MSPGTTCRLSLVNFTPHACHLWLYQAWVPSSPDVSHTVRPWRECTPSLGVGSPPCQRALGTPKPVLVAFRGYAQSGEAFELPDGHVRS